jgi:hypothetical protein
MEEIKKISVEQCCLYYSVETAFVQQLDEHGLIVLEHSDKEAFIEYDQLPDLERYMRMHYDLHINMEGMHAIKHLLHQIHTLQTEMKRLQEDLSEE